MINETRVVETGSCHTYGGYRKKCLSWSAILAGAIVGTGIGFLLNLFGVAIGLSAFSNTSEGVTAFAIGGFIGLIIIAVVSMFLAGMVAGYLGRKHCYKRNLGILYGFLAWSVALFLAFLLVAPATRFVTQYNHTLVPSADVVVANPTGNSSTVINAQGATVNAPALNSTNSAAAATTEKAANTLGMATFVTFILFAVGAFSACLGGHCGMKCKCDDDYIEETKVTREEIR